MDRYLITSFPFADSNASAHFEAGSALSEFMAGTLGAPSCWPAETHRASPFLRVQDEVLSIQRWENEGGRAFAPAARAKGPKPALQRFRPSGSLLIPLI